MQLQGKVVRRPFGGASKSAHEAVMLVTKDGTYRLRRADGNPFRDPALDALVGSEIVCDGQVHQGTVIMTSWVESGEAK